MGHFDRDGNCPPIRTGGRPRAALDGLDDLLCDALEVVERTAKTDPARAARSAVRYLNAIRKEIAHACHGA